MSGRELLTPDEVRLLNNEYAILFIRGAKAILDKKYNLMTHRHIKLTTDGGNTPYIHSTITTTPLTESIDLDRAEEYIIIDPD